jgi:hypothetical protein
MMAALTLASISVQAAKTGMPSPDISECMGVNIHFIGENDTEVKQIAKAGFRIVRAGFPWDWVENEKGKYDFSTCDAMMAVLDRYGVRPAFIVCDAIPLFSKLGHSPANDEDRAAFAAFVGAAAAHFKGRGAIWELWNEPNWGGWSAGSENYAKLANLVGKAVHEADPTAVYAGPAAAHIDLGFLENIFQSGTLEQFDLITVHPYRGGECGPETAIPEYKSLRNLIDKYAPKGKNIPYAAGEWGYSMVGGLSAERQAEYFVRMMLTNMLVGAKYTIWYDWSDDGDDPNYFEHHFGTVYKNLRPKPTYIAAQVLYRQLEDYKLAARVQLENSDDYILIFKQGKYAKLAAWTTGTPHEIELPLDVPGVTLADMYGKRSSSKVANGVLKMQLNQSVTYVGLLGESKRMSLEESLTVDPIPATDPTSGSYPIVISFKNPLDCSIKANAILKDSISGKFLASADFTIAAGKKVDKAMNLRIAWDGSAKFGAVVEVSVDGFDKPLRRYILFDASHVSTAALLPSVDDSANIMVTNPTGNPCQLTLKVEGKAVPVKFEKGQNEVIIKSSVKLTEPKCKGSIANSKGTVLYKFNCLEYKPSLTMDDGNDFSIVVEGNAPSGGGSVSTSPLPEKLFDINSCVKLDYTYVGGSKFTRVCPKVADPIGGKPRMLGIWVYGDNSGNMVSNRFIDASGQIFQTRSNKIDFQGWKLLTWPLNQSQMGSWGGDANGIIRWPLKWDTALLLDSKQTPSAGAIYIGSSWLMY